jgi:hypothetical protein
VIDLPTWAQAGVAIVGFLQFLLLVFIVPIRGAIDRLKESDDRLREDFNQWRLEVAEKYVREDKADRQHAEVLAALRRVEAQVGALQRDKADK